MATQAVTAKIVDELNNLAVEQQREVLAFARSLKSQPSGVEGSSLVNFAGGISATDLTQIQEAIEEGCQSIDF